MCLKQCTNFETVQLKITGIDFDQIWQKYSKDSRIEFAFFSFHVPGRFAFLSTFRLSKQTPQITPFLTLYQSTLTPFSKENKILIKHLYKCKGHNARQLTTEFPDKDWTKNSIYGEAEKV